LLSPSPCARGCEYVVPSETLSRVDALRWQDRALAAVEVRNTETGARSYKWAHDLEPLDSPSRSGARVRERLDVTRNRLLVGGALMMAGGAGIIVGGVAALGYERPKCEPGQLCFDFFNWTAVSHVFGGLLLAFGGAIAIGGAVLAVMGILRAARSSTVPFGRRGIFYFDLKGAVWRF